MRYICDVCGFVYDEDQGCAEKGIVAGTKWADVEDSFDCPVCAVSKDQFSAE